jgi:hypothetical protein
MPTGDTAKVLQAKPDVDAKTWGHLARQRRPGATRLPEDCA